MDDYNQGFWGSYFNPTAGAQQYTDRIPQMISQQLSPFSFNQNPSQLQDAYQASPGYGFARDEALSAAQRAASAGGMAGSPQHMQQNMQIASGLASQDYNNWANRAYDAAKTQAGYGAQSLAQKGAFSQYNAQHQNQMINALLQMLMGGAGYAMGGPFGNQLSKYAMDYFGFNQ